MVERSAQAQQAGKSGDAPAEFGRLAAEMLHASSAMAAHPLLAHPAAAMAAATAVGFGFSTQMAGAFFSALEDAVKVTNKLAATFSEPRSRAAGVSAEPEAEAPVEAEAVTVEAVEAVEEIAAVFEASAPAPVAVKARAPKVRAPKAQAAAPAPAAVVVPAAPEAEAPLPHKPSAAKVPASSRRAAAKSDDLKRISGIGPKLEQVLHRHGVHRFAEIAAWSAADIADFDAELGMEGRIGRDDWVSQARALAGGKA